MRNFMRVRRSFGVTAGALALVLIAAPAAMAGGNWSYGESRTVLSNGALYTSIEPNNDGTGYWHLNDWYDKTGGGTISLEFGFNYHGYSYGSHWQSESAGGSNSQEFYSLGFTDCDDVVGWMAVAGQSTFYNAPVTTC
ncbi:hypothetical protein [Streptacidiphilus sp. EB129]|uniref:hypothetical protein n=1 Tax=Streptacidiphilus sp. EB129 TaxID=3156262 RepID=UPI0035176CDD